MAEPVSASNDVELELNRRWLSPQSTIGELTRAPSAWSTATLSAGGELLAFTLEDVRRGPGEKVPGKTCIPEGRYEIIRTMSNRFGVVMPLLFNVHTKEGRLLVQNNGVTFEGIRIHWGNHALDTDGCILVGRSRSRDEIFSSKDAYKRIDAQLERWLLAGRVWVTVKLAPPTERAVC